MSLPSQRDRIHCNRDLPWRAHRARNTDSLCHFDLADNIAKRPDSPGPTANGQRAL